MSCLVCALIVLVSAAAPASAETGTGYDVGGMLANAGFKRHGDESSKASTPGREKAGRSESAGSSASSEQATSRRSKGVRTASLGNRSSDESPKPGRSLSGGGNVSWVANAGCLASNLRSTINYVAQNYGSVTVSSTCRDHAHNRRVGGAPKSYHLSGDAADFRVHGNYGAAYAYLRSAVGGLKHYGGGLFHIDNGPSRSF